MTVTTTAPAPATESQISFIRRLVAERDTSAERVTAVWEELEAARVATVAGTFSKRNASRLIETLLGAPKKDAAETVRAKAPEGMHKFGGVFFKVQVAKNGSGNLYAKVLEEDGNGGWTFAYAPGAVRNLSEATTLGAEDAAAFGALYGICCACGRSLTDERSIHAGYGPVCAQNNGWAWGETAEVAPPAAVVREDDDNAAEYALAEADGFECTGCEESDGEPHWH